MQCMRAVKGEHHPTNEPNRFNHTAHTLITSVCSSRRIITIIFTNLLVDPQCSWTDNHSLPESRAHTESSEHYLMVQSDILTNRAQYEEYNSSSVQLIIKSLHEMTR